MPPARNPMTSAALVWFRRDLRLDDHHALSEALRHHPRVWACFVLDREILDELPAYDRRVDFLVRCLHELDADLRALGSGLIVRHGFARTEIPRLAAELGVQAVYANHDDDPQAVARDADVARALGEQGRELRTWQDVVVFERSQILTKQDTPYAVFTPYKAAWLQKLSPRDVQPWPVEAHLGALAPLPSTHASPLPTLEDLGFQPTNVSEVLTPGVTGAVQALTTFRQKLPRYHHERDVPALQGTSGLSVHLRFGTVSVRTLVRMALEEIHDEGPHTSPRGQQGQGAEAWLAELVWRDFYHMILHHHPRVVGHAFRPEYDALTWDDDPALWQAWCEGQTGYPLVDAAMRELRQTGWMHNRLRMVTASFLVKDLGIDWRRGEAFFAGHLNDFDLAANNGGWQWAAGTGCDAQPYFRIFHPVTQSERFDPHGTYVRRWLPELRDVPDRWIHAPWRDPQGPAPGYPLPVVDHAQARVRTLERFGRVRTSVPRRSTRLDP